MTNSSHFNPEFEFLVNELKLQKTNDSLLVMNYTQLEKFYNYYNLKDITYENLDTESIKTILNIIYKYKKFHSSKSEKKTWFLNIKHTYELLNQIPNIKNKNIQIHFEYKLFKHRLDTLIKYNNSYFIIEYSHLKNNESLNKKLNEKQEQLDLYNLLFYHTFNIEPKTSIYLNNIEDTKNNTLDLLKDFLK